MKQTKTLLAWLLIALMLVSVVGCTKKIDVNQATTPTEAPKTETKTETEAKPAETAEAKPAEEPVKELTYADGTMLRIAAGYNNRKNALTFDPDIAKDGITLADGKTYNAGDLKPTWVEVENLLNIKIEDKFTGAGSANKEFDYWKERLDEVDLVNGGAAQLSENGVAGNIVNLAEYLDLMPNFKAYLEANPIVRLSITGDTNTGAIYFAPYFDGVNDIEKMPLMRVDWVVKLLDGEGEFAAEACKDLKAAAYAPYMPTTGKVDVDVVEPDGKTVKTIAKNYDKAGNIVENMNKALAAGTVTGVDAVNMLRKYIDEAYDGYYGTTRSNLFVGQNAAWDADELVALLRCVVANPQTINGTETVQGLFSREEANPSRRADMYRLAGVLFGVRGTESRQDFLYVGTDGKLHDARQEADLYKALERMNAMVQEGLISEAFVNGEAVKTEQYLEQDLGFMHYDYNQTQTLYNKTKLDNAAGEKYMAVMIPVARWNDGTEKFMRFTESWRSIKTDAWGISVKGVADDTNKLNAALKLFDFAFSPEGQILMSYGPDAFIKTKADGSYETFNFNGKEMPVIADATWDELWEKANGNYTNYARQFLGSTLSFVKSQAFEYQCTCEVGKEGAGYISNAIAAGTIHHPELAVTENPWYTSVPTVLPTTKEENTLKGSYSDLTNNFYTGNKEGVNILVDQIVKGYTVEGMTDAETSAAYVADTMSGAQYLAIQQTAYGRILKYYEGLAK